MVIDDLYYRVSDFIADDGAVFHGFFGRQGGVSEGVYASLNCGAGSDDNPAHVERNRAIVAKAAGGEPDHLLSLYQIHSDICLTIDAPFDQGDRPQADAMVTDKAGIALGVLAADCTPILFYGSKSDGAPVIGAAHAGWGGALKGISKSTVEAMVALGAGIDSISACIGPCIAQGSYEVSDDFKTPFLEEDAGNDVFFIQGERDGHLMFDLVGYNASKLRKAGVNQIHVQGLDTYTHEDAFFSYRRKTHKKERDYGRQISVIKIN